MPKITNFLWFEEPVALQAAKYYTTIFKGKYTKITSIEKDASAKGKQSKTILAVWFKLNGQDFAALNGGVNFKFNESVSFVVNCKDQKEVDYYWKKLSAGGKEVQCGWLKDKYGVTWQITPKDTYKYCFSKNKAGATRAMTAMRKMIKLDIAKLKKAYENK